VTPDDNVSRLSEAYGAKPEWHHELIRTDNGKPVANLANALCSLRNDDAFTDMFALDEMLCAPVLLRPLDGDEFFKPRPMNDVDVSLMQERLQQTTLLRLSKDTAHQAVEVVAHRGASIRCAIT
jgi:hypothetical protein